ncbi:MAG: FAD-dependent oxidoreductase [Clostridiales bacterium]|jgi:formate dehydrogenase major subunit|nr:FAD-dependent oxidoreductase [Clostridiales bacterium]
MPTITINGVLMAFDAGERVLSVVRRAGFAIPTLCDDARVPPTGACGMCVVEMSGTPRLARACSTEAKDGMSVVTESARISRSRRAALSLLLSDHRGDCRPPCQLACPGDTDCQGYVGLIANGEASAARELIMERIPFPASIGRVCPHPCEKKCRRANVDEPIAIAALKRFAGDALLDGAGAETPPPVSGASVAVVGGGPSGLSAAYYLRRLGRAVTVFDAQPMMGGMLRYGIPEYRLPKAVLDKEIARIRLPGIEFRNNARLGRDISIESLRAEYGAVVLAVGAWKSAPLGCPGEGLSGVIGGIDFLRAAAEGTAPDLAGRTVAVVGGGNTAMDCCRTAVRLGAGRVYVVYRRTAAEMPAEPSEIEEALEEGVVFENLRAPAEVLGDSVVTGIRLDTMTLGEPDASGRRRPVPDGGSATLSVDRVITAIGQWLEPEGLEGVALTRRGTIAADEATFETNISGVFAVGDATNRGADIAITAIGEGRYAAETIDAWLGGREPRTAKPFVVTSEPDASEYEERVKLPRQIPAAEPPEDRRRDFREVTAALDPESAAREAARCLECGCADYFECKLLAYTREYANEPARYGGYAHKRARVTDHPYLTINPDKCVLCGLCVRVCERVAGAAALGMESRGFATRVSPAMGLPLMETACVSCGMCAAVCPTGAITERMAAAKQVPLAERRERVKCPYCEFGCPAVLTSAGGAKLRLLPDTEADPRAALCARGRFGLLGDASAPMPPVNGKLFQLRH